MNCDNLNKLNLLKTTKTIKMDDVWRRHWLLGVCVSVAQCILLHVIFLFYLELDFGVKLIEKSRFIF